MNRKMRCPTRVLLVLLLSLPVLSCECKGGGSDPSIQPQDPRAGRYRHARSTALAWLDRLRVDTVELQEHGVKGKKKLGEILGGYWTFYKYSESAEQRAHIRRRVEQLTEQVKTRAYHNMLTCSDAELKQNSMSYFRVLVMMERFDLEPSAYRRRLLEAKGRFDAHLSQRGDWQRAMFAEYYEHFELKKPPVIQDARAKYGVISRRLPQAKYDDRAAYRLTHEVFVAFDYGERTEQARFDADDLAYLERTLPTLSQRIQQAKNPDLLAELLSCMTYLGFTADPRFTAGIDYLLESQNESGSWGSYESYREQYGKFLEQHLYLHTTVVASSALLEAFERRGDDPKR